MTFKEITNGNTVFILNKNEFSLVHGTVTRNEPRIEMDEKTFQRRPVVDLTVDINGRPLTFTIPENHSITHSTEYILSTDQSLLASEIKYIWSQSKQFLDSIPYHQSIARKAPALLAEIDPVYKDRQDNENRFSKIEGSIEDLTKMVKSFIEEFKK